MMREMHCYPDLRGSNVAWILTRFITICEYTSLSPKTIENFGFKW